MQIPLTRDELETLLEALDCWARQPAVSPIGRMMASVIAGSKAEYEHIMSEIEAHHSRDAADRRMRSVLLQAKLVEAMQIVDEQRDGENKPASCNGD